MNQHHVTFIINLPYSPNLELADSFLFPRCKGVIKRKHFADIPVIRWSATRVLRSIRKMPLMITFLQLYLRCYKNIEDSRCCFEGVKRCFVSMICFVCFMLLFNEFFIWPCMRDFFCICMSEIIVTRQQNLRKTF